MVVVESRVKEDTKNIQSDDWISDDQCVVGRYFERFLKISWHDDEITIKLIVCGFNKLSTLLAYSTTWCIT